MTQGDVAPRQARHGVLNEVDANDGTSQRFAECPHHRLRARAHEACRERPLVTPKKCHGQPKGLGNVLERLTACSGDQNCRGCRLREARGRGDVGHRQVAKVVGTGPIPDRDLRRCEHQAGSPADEIQAEPLVAVVAKKREGRFRRQAMPVLFHEEETPHPRRPVVVGGVVHGAAGSIPEGLDGQAQAFGLLHQEHRGQDGLSVRVQTMRSRQGLAFGNPHRRVKATGFRVKQITEECSHASNEFVELGHPVALSTLEKRRKREGGRPEPSRPFLGRAEEDPVAQRSAKERQVSQRPLHGGLSLVAPILTKGQGGPGLPGDGETRRGNRPLERVHQVVEPAVTPLVPRQKPFRALDGDIDRRRRSRGHQQSVDPNRSSGRIDQEALHRRTFQLLPRVPPGSRKPQPLPDDLRIDTDPQVLDHVDRPICRIGVLRHELPRREASAGCANTVDTRSQTEWSGEFGSIEARSVDHDIHLHGGLDRHPLQLGLQNIESGGKARTSVASMQGAPAPDIAREHPDALVLDRGAPMAPVR